MIPDDVSETICCLNGKHVDSDQTLHSCQNITCKYSADVFSCLELQHVFIEK